MNALITVDAALPGTLTVVTPLRRRRPPTREACASAISIGPAIHHCAYGVVPTFTGIDAPARLEAPAQRLWADTPPAIDPGQQRCPRKTARDARQVGEQPVDDGGYPVEAG
jgi:hypothetical protein